MEKGEKVLKNSHIYVGTGRMKRNIKGRDQSLLILFVFCHSFRTIEIILPNTEMSERL